MAYTTREGHLTEQCIKYLKSLESQGVPIYWEHRSGTGGFSYKKGIPDLFVVINGIHIEVELKAKNGKRSSMQDKWAYKFSILHIHYVCPHSLNEFVEYISQFICEKDTKGENP